MFYPGECSMCAWEEYVFYYCWAECARAIINYKIITHFHANNKEKEKKS